MNRKELVEYAEKKFLDAQTSTYAEVSTSNALQGILALMLAHEKARLEKETKIDL